MRIASLTFACVLAGMAAGCSSTGTSVPSLAFGEIPGFRDSENRAVGSALLQALNGGILPPDIRSQMDSPTRAAALQAEYQALEYTPAGEKVGWGRPGQRLSGEVVASQPYRVGSQDCRQYTHTVLDAGQPLSNRGTACRNADGSWTPLT